MKSQDHMNQNYEKQQKIYIDTQAQVIELTDIDFKLLYVQCDQKHDETES